MDRHQREVLRRKRFLLAKTFNFSEESQQLYRDHGLLNDQDRERIMVRRGWGWGCGWGWG